MLKPVTVVAALLVAPVAVLSACTTNQPSNNQPSSSSPPPGTERLSTQLTAADGTTVANATLDFANGYATVTVETVAAGILTPGFDGLHIHSVGKCEANSVGPSGSASGDFNSAGGHYQAPGHTGYPASGDLTSLEVRSDGSAKLVTTTNAFTAADLRGDDGTALIVQSNGTPGPDQETLATGDSGKRVACGVIAPASTTSTSTSTSTVTTTVTAPAGPAVTTTAQPSSVPSGTSTSTSTSTSTVTAPSVSTTTPPAPG